MTPIPARAAPRRPTPPARALLLAALLAAPRPLAAEDVDCVMEPRVEVDLVSGETGRVAEVAVSRGDRVGEGDVLVRLDDTLQRLQVDLAQARMSDVDLRAAQARLAAAEVTLARVRELASRDAAPAAALEEAEVEGDLARLAVEQAGAAQAVAALEHATAEALLDRRTILSPVDGVVTEVLAAPGELATDQSRLLSIAEIDPLRIEAFVGADHYGRLHVGETFDVRQAPPLDGRFRARLTVVDQVFDAASGTFGIRLELPNPDGALPAGVRCVIDLPDDPAAPADAP